MKNALSTRHGGRGYKTPDSAYINRPGVFMTIPIADLKIDTEYQRPLTGFRVDRIKENWSWIACGAVTVALRGEGSGNYFVIDGQHRVAAAERAGITELPCLVFETTTSIDEAQGFLDVNTARKAMSVLDRYRALLTIGDPIALKTKSLLEIANRDPSDKSNSEGKSIKCLEFLMQAVITDEETLTHIWPLVIDICDGRLITKRLLQGLFYSERFLTNTSLLDRHWRRRLLQVGYDGISRSIDETCAFEGRAGGAVCAQGLLRAVNKGLRNKLKINIKTTENPEETDE